MKIKDGGAIANLTRRTNIEEIRVKHLRERIFELWINDDCLSYLTLEEVLDLRDEINKAIKFILMDKTIKDKTIEELLLERRILIKKITSLWCAYDEYVTITVQIEAIDKFIKQLNNIKD